MSPLREDSLPPESEPERYGSRDEVLSSSERTRVFRRHWEGGGSIICKEALGPDAVERLRHELAMLGRLAGVEGVPQLASSPPPERTLAFEDADGVALLAAFPAPPLETHALLALFLGMARLLAAIHHCGVVHKNLNPRNILIYGAGRRPMLIDFELASTVAEERPGFTHHREVAGSLAYLSPEQTGRTGRTVDQRADLYSLGATFYELATGQLPFGSGDTLQLIHDHLARVPRAPLDLNPRLPRGLSDIILHLLEKEPDRRYQSAEGLAHDLSALIEGLARGGGGVARLGERDFPRRLAAPSRLVGREPEIAALQAAFENVARRPGRGVLVSGGPGIGKTVLINELRPMVTARRGWFIAGKFDQYRHDAASAAVQALRALGRLLLAEPEAELVPQKARILLALGPNAGLITTLLPEFELLLGAQPEIVSSDPLEAEARQRLAMLELLRAVATPTRPVALFLDDLQWASVVSIRFIDSVLSDDSLRNLLLVGAYRDAEVPATHPLFPMLSRWQSLAEPPRQLLLNNLPPPDLGAMLSAMLRLPPEQASQAARLAESVGVRTGGNPYETVELVNALRQDGALVLEAEGWRWNEGTIRRYVGRGNVVDLLATRIARLPAASGALLEVMACLGGEPSLGLIEAASGLSRAELEAQLASPLEDGLLLMEQGGAVRFRHDRVQQASYGRLDAAGRCRLHLALARRLAALPERGIEAAEQYLPAVEGVREGEERRRVVALFQVAAGQARLATNFTTVERFLAAAITLLDLPALTPDPASAYLLTRLETGRHAALYNLGRLDEADGLYHAIEGRCATPFDLVDASCVQLDSLCNRGRQREAVALGMDLLQRLGLSVPHENVAAEVAQRLGGLYRWVAEESDPREQHKMDEPRLIAAARVLNRLLAPAFFCDPTVTAAWVVLESHRLWVEHGSCAPLVATTSMVSPTVIALRQDYRTGYVAARHTVLVGETCGYQPDTSWARHIFTLFSQHWFEPLEDSLGQARLAREGLLQGGDLQFACYTYYNSLASLLDCAPTLGSCAAEAETALGFAARTGNGHANGTFLSYRQLLRAMRGETGAPGSFSDDGFDEDRHLAGLSSNQMAAGVFHALRAVAAAIFDDADNVHRHSARAMALMPYIEGFYLTALVHALQALSLAQAARVAEGPALPALLAELDARRAWLARRAGDAPMNFRPLLNLVDAEQAWTAGEEERAARAYEEALREAHPRPWQRAFITERAGIFHLAHGRESGGRQLLAEARRFYAAWGATGKVQQLEQGHPYLATFSHHSSVDPRQHRIVSTEAIDMLAILRASQALSSETSLEQLKNKVIEVLGAMTGATSVALLLWQEDAREWSMLPTSGTGAKALPVSEAGRLGLLPLSVFRYAERTREPLLVEDAVHDDRFARDPYFGPLAHCSLMLVPIVHHGKRRAMLLMENQLSRGSFSADRLNVVLLIAGQLAVSLENALLYERLEATVEVRTRELREANVILQHDIQERLAVENALRKSEAKFSAIFSLTPDAMALSRVSDGVLLEVNRSFTEYFGYSPGEANGRSTLPHDLGIWCIPGHRQAFLEELACQGDVRGFETTMRRKDGSLATVLVSGKGVDFDGERCVILHSHDITQRKQHEERLDQIAHHDALTKLPNRLLLNERLHQAILHSERSDTRVAVCYLDLDGFKAVNDSFGHPAGDLLLIEVAHRLSAGLRGRDTVARLGGDEFVLLLSDLIDDDECWRVLDRLLPAISAPYQIGAAESPLISASIGVTIFPSDLADPDTLLRHADHAMYVAKQAGKNRYHLFDTRQERRIEAHHARLQEIEEALASRQFRLYYQPKVDCRQGRIVGAEALIRWQHPRQGLLLPADFLPLVEDDPLSIPIGNWVIGEALRQMGAWQQEGISLPVSVNAFARQLLDPGFSTGLAALLQEHPEVAPHALQVEIVETAALSKLDTVQEVIGACRSLGVGFSIDDFGTGYSSLIYLRHLPAEEIKIDQSFVRNMLGNAEDRMIVEAVIALGRAFHLSVVAEGAESPAHIACLLAMGCDVMQGYALARPMPADEFARWAHAFEASPAGAVIAGAG